MSSAHWAAMAFTALVAGTIIAFRTRLRKAAADRTARLGLASVLIASEVSLYVWYGFTGNWGLHALPFQLCTMTLWLSVAALLSGNPRLSEPVFFLGVLGALQAVVTPNLEETFPNFRYFHFFVAHAAIIGAGTYITAVAGYRPSSISAWRAWGWLNLLAVPAGIANAVTGENFMFLARKPDTASMLDLLAPWPWYVLQLEVIALALCLLLAGVVRLSDKGYGK
nr:TIGR02206 family membrane protein [Cohnella sp. CFH 77786]